MDTQTTSVRTGDPVRPPTTTGRTTVIVAYSLCLVALVASTIALNMVMTDPDMHFMWVMTVMGALVIGVLLSAAVIPHLRRDH